MFNIDEVVQLALAADQIARALHLTDEEKAILLTALRDAIPDTLPGLPQHTLTVRGVIDRMIDDPGTRNARPEAQKQGRKAKGRKEPTEVAAGRAEEATEAPEGSPEGS